jgi:putative secretion ATPase (PEP-CTERM system associated)
MYERYFQLRERPFALSPDPEYLYPSKVHQEALSYLRYGIEGHAGFVVITGEIGSGKTTMLQSLLGRLDRNTTVARLVNTMLDPRELLEAIMLDFGMDPTGMSKPVLLHRLGQFLVHQRQAGRLTLLIIDEAQNLSLPALEEIRMLSNLETEKSKLIQIILIGQPELRDKLASSQLEQLRQRITVSYHLQPLDAEETANYVNHRLRRAAAGTPVVFPREVTNLIHARSRGVPRIINVIADATLLFAYGVDRREVDASIVQEALDELDATGVLASYHAEGGHPEAAIAAATAAVPAAVTAAAPTPDPRAVEEARRRENELQQREQQLAMREQALAAQKKVMEEEARLLASARAHAPASAMTPAAHGVAPAVSPVAPAVSAAAPTVSPVAPVATTVASSVIRPASAETPTAPVVNRIATPRPPVAPAVLTPSGVRVQRYQPTMYPPPATRYGMWERLRRVLFGVTG